ncbi:MAG TPA: LPS export ABC transporter periplasmic protein LptC [Oligoflexia bacterium]|nr:LPS export ABC transporter periplasmic protein LptC [Oligoflexia bacterium]HMP49322.1 LPS export ABC transporter periplasmic protein LptC [Oligoflexia bacterium]
MSSKTADRLADSFRFIQNMQPLQRAGLWLGSLYLVFFLFHLFFYSSGRGLSLSHNAASISESEFESMDRAQVVINLFNRSEFKEGKRSWNVDAKTARYLSSENVILLDTPNMTIFRDKNEPPTTVNAKSARLHVVDGQVISALLQGDVKIAPSPDLSIFTAVAEYRQSDGRLITPDRVYIKGPAYEISGERMDLAVERGFVSIYEKVESRFDSGKSSQDAKNGKGHRKTGNRKKDKLIPGISSFKIPVKTSNGGDTESR